MQMQSAELRPLTTGHWGTGESVKRSNHGKRRTRETGNRRRGAYLSSMRNEHQSQKRTKVREYEGTGSERNPISNIERRRSNVEFGSARQPTPNEVCTRAIAPICPGGTGRVSVSWTHCGGRIVGDVGSKTTCHFSPFNLATRSAGERTARMGDVVDQVDLLIVSIAQFGVRNHDHKPRDLGWGTLLTKWTYSLSQLRNSACGITTTNHGTTDY